MRKTDDPVADFALWDAEQQRQAQRLPECANCGEPIMADYFYEIEGVNVCPDCMDSDYRRNTDDYME